MHSIKFVLIGMLSEIMMFALTSFNKTRTNDIAKLVFTMQASEAIGNL